MSRLQTHLHALPPGSIVSKQLHASNTELNRLLDQKREEEILIAKQVQKQTRCTWPEAIRSVIEHQH
jgi:hypothetical protein